MNGDPSPAQRADWFRSNNEAAHTNDELYGKGHRPAYALVGAMWAPVCGCTNPRCFLAEDDSRRLYQTAEEALDAAAKNLHDNEHGPGMETP